MNEEHIIAAILTVGLLEQNKTSATPAEAVSVYHECLTELLESIRPPRTDE